MYKIVWMGLSTALQSGPYARTENNTPLKSAILTRVCFLRNDQTKTKEHSIFSPACELHVDTHLPIRRRQRNLYELLPANDGRSSSASM